MNRFRRFFCCAAILAGFFSASPGHVSPAAPPAVPATNPELVNTCLITSRFADLVSFYSDVLGISPNISGGIYAEFQSSRGVLAIFTADAQEQYIPGSAEPGKNRSSILEFRVADVDAEFARLQPIVKTWVKPPTNQPWGTRSFYFRDPDGNLVDFFAPAKK
jgi:catechol 2,3-dioxygenase-like lactoylglutathione lyase family enzyme